MGTHFIFFQLLTFDFFFLAYTMFIYYFQMIIIHFIVNFLVNEFFLHVDLSTNQSSKELFLS